MSTVLDQLPTLPKSEPGKTINGKRIRVPPRVVLGELTPNNIGTLKKLNMCLFPVSYSDRFYKDALSPELEDYCKLVFYQDLAVGNVVCRLEPASSPAPTTINDSVTPAVAPVPSSSSSSAPTAPAPAASPATTGEKSKLYVMVLGVLSPYRRQGLATKLIQQVIAAAEASHLPPPPPATASKDKESAEKKAKKSDDKKDKKKDETPVGPKAIVESIYLHVQVSNDEARTFWERNGFKVTGTVQNYYRKIEPRDAWVLERAVAAPAKSEA